MPRFKNRNTRYRTSRVWKRSSRRKSYGRKKPKRTSRRPMTKKRILNTTSVKKRNGMLSFSNTTATGASQTTAQATAFVNATQLGYFLFAVTDQNLAANAGGSNLRINTAQRTATTCFMRGFSEHLRIQTSSGLPWFHRRICFTTRGASSFNIVDPNDTQVQASGNSIDTSSGQQRLWLNASVNNQPNTINNQYNILFKGQRNIDWNDPIIAPVDTTRVDLKFDKTWLIKSGNASGTITSRKLWHRMNKNLVYSDDENGEAMATSYASTASKQGMGDYYILDLFQAGIGGSATDIINVFSNSTLYWHEK
ncbi:capsid protein [Faeces associated gemycircularvirus 16]|uniref:Capsid protein n=1 Tax=Faeces associated gemycircularvirus 16 TaxID=1843736 RepID=A0A168MGB1_9VIRU|nr:capsid protein [Faeces associated gemycircularvirus 16]